MSVVHNILEPVPIPRIVRVGQEFADEHIADVAGHLRRALLSSPAYARIEPGRRIAITAGSRGISAMLPALRLLCGMVREKGAHPFLVPAMGSHGGATAEGQRRLLADLGVTEEAVGAPILSSMEVDLLGEVMDGRPVYIDRNANRADGIIVINRIKAHTSFRGRYESGLMKMMAIGLGKHKGAQHYHQTGVYLMDQVVETVGRAVLERAKISFGVAIVDNAFGRPNLIEVIEPGDIPEREAALLTRANDLMPRLFMDRLDALIIRDIGKEISGTGIDTNVVGRYYNERIVSERIFVRRIALLNLTDKSHGNANGVGLGDFITRRLFDKIDMNETYPNALTTTASVAVKIPMVLDNDRLAVQAAIETALLLDKRAARVALIESTKNLAAIYVSENLAGEAAQSRFARVEGSPFEMPFDEKGNLILDF